MKKTISLILAIALVFALAACGEPPVEENNGEVAKLFADGYSVVMLSCDEESLAALFQKDNSYEAVYKIKAKLTPAQYAQYSEASASEDSEKDVAEFLKGLDGVTVIDITSAVPTEEMLSQYKGMTFGELENEGFERSGYSGDEGIYVFFYDGPLYSVMVSPEDGVLIEDMDDYSENDIRALKIGGVEFCGFSFDILEAED